METRYASVAPTENVPESRERPGRPERADALERIRSRVSREVGPDRFDRYFGAQAVLNLDGERLDVTVPTRFLAELIDRRFGQVLRSAAREVLAPESDRAPEPQVNFRVDSAAFGRSGAAVSADRKSAEPPAPSRPRRAVALTRTARGEASSRYSLTSFVVGTSNRLAHAASVRIAEEDGPASLHRVFIQGCCGVGKTHLLRGIAARFKELHPGARVRYVSGEEFTNEFIGAVRGGTLEAFRRSYRKVDLLCLDDAHFLSSKEKTQTELLHTFDTLDLDGARIVIASDEHPRDIRQLSEQLVSRFLSAGVVRIEPPEPELRERIVRALAATRGVRIDEGAVRLIVERAGARSPGSRPSVRDLEGALTQAEAMARVVGGVGAPGAITPGVARRALGFEETVGAPSRSGRPVPFQLVISETCRELGVSHEDFCGRGRHKKVVLARALSAYIGRSLTTLSFPEMARLMGRPTHSTLIMACARVRARLERDADLGGADQLGVGFEGMTLRQFHDRLRETIVRAAERA